MRTEKADLGRSCIERWLPHWLWFIVVYQVCRKKECQNRKVIPGHFNHCRVGELSGRKEQRFPILFKCIYVHLRGLLRDLLTKIATIVYRCEGFNPRTLLADELDVKAIETPVFPDCCCKLKYAYRACWWSKAGVQFFDTKESGRQQVPVPLTVGDISCMRLSKGETQIGKESLALSSKILCCILHSCHVRSAWMIRAQEVLLATAERSLGPGMLYLLVSLKQVSWLSLLYLLQLLFLSNPSVGKRSLALKSCQRLWGSLSCSTLCLPTSVQENNERQVVLCSLKLWDEYRHVDCRNRQRASFTGIDERNACVTVRKRIVLIHSLKALARAFLSSWGGGKKCTLIILTRQRSFIAVFCSWCFVSYKQEVSSFFKSSFPSGI